MLVGSGSAAKLEAEQVSARAISLVGVSLRYLQDKPGQLKTLAWYSPWLTELDSSDVWISMARQIFVSHVLRNVFISMQIASYDIMMQQYTTSHEMYQ